VGIACFLRLASAVPALLLCACARDPYVVAPLAAMPTSGNFVAVGNWRIERQPDRVTGTPISSAILVTRTSSSSQAVISQPASMQLGCFLGKPVVTFNFTYKIGTNLNSFLGYRFDDKPGHEIGGRFVKDTSAVVIEEPPEVAQFVSELATSHSLYVRVRSINAGRTSAEFTVDGAPAAIESAFAGCPATLPAAAAKQAAPEKEQQQQHRRPSAWARDAAS
jgi:hypothetical protein